MVTYALLAWAMVLPLIALIAGAFDFINAAHRAMDAGRVVFALGTGLLLASAVERACRGRREGNESHVGREADGLSA